MFISAFVHFNTRISHGSIIFAIPTTFCQMIQAHAIKFVLFYRSVLCFTSLNANFYAFKINYFIYNHIPFLKLMQYRENEILYITTSVSSVMTMTLQHFPFPLPHTDIKHSISNPDTTKSRDLQTDFLYLTCYLFL